MTFKDTAHYLCFNCPITVTTNRDLVSTMLQTSTVNSQVEVNNTQQLDMKSTVALFQFMIEETSVSHVYHAMSSQALRNQLHILDLIWRKLEPRLQVRIEEIK